MNERSNILGILESAPAELATLAKTVAERRKDLDLAKHALTVAKARAGIRYQEAKNQTILRSRIDADEEVSRAEVAVIQAKANFEISEIEHRKVYDQFISARKIAGLDERELHAISGSTVRGAVVRDELGNRVNSETGEILDAA